jgi:hypothetical protein
MGLLSQLRRFRTRVGNVMASSPGLVYVFLLIVFLELEESAQRAPTIRLLENAICLQYYRDHSAAGVVGDVDESMCKTPSIQSKLARTRGVLSLVDAVPG